MPEHPATATLAEIERIVVADCFNRHVRLTRAVRPRVAEELQLGIRTAEEKVRACGGTRYGRDLLAVPPLPQSLLDLADQQRGMTAQPEARAASAVPLDFPPIARAVERKLLELLADHCERKPLDLEPRLREICGLLQRVRIGTREEAA